MKTNNLAVNTVVAMKRAVVGIALIGAGLLGITPFALANGGRAMDLVAPYAYFAWAVPPATGPFTTHYLITAKSAAITVNVKCYSDSAGTRVGPAAGTTFNINPNATAWADPGSLGLTTDPFFTGFGWCYFAGIFPDDYFSVDLVAGISVGGNLITTNNSRAIMSGTAQHMVTTGPATIPYWTKEGSWDTYFLALNPTTASRTLVTNAYTSSGALIGTWTTTLGSRDMDYGTIAALVGAPGYTSWGNADISVSGRGFVGWTAGINFTSFQAFISSVPLSSLWLSELVGADRP